MKSKPKHVSMQGNGPYSAMQLIQTVLRWLAAVFFVVAGTLHFVKPELYLKIMPPYLPDPPLLVMASGMAEIAGGFGLLIRPLRRAAGWGLMALLLAILPANIYMAQHPENFHLTPWLLWARLPIQALLLAWVWFAAIQRPLPTGFISRTPP